MADRRLVWNNLAAPDLSAASAALARANQSFNTSMDTGASILAKYGAGQQEKADNEILAELAGLKDESQYDSWIDSGALQGRNLSSGMRDHLLSMRSNFVSDEGVRADTRGTNARTANTRATMGINQAREARSAAEYLDMTRQRDAGRKTAGLGMDAYGFKSQNGNVVGDIKETTNSNTRLMLARTLQAEAGNEGFQGMLDVGSVIRNRAASGRYGENIDGVIMKPGQFSAWNSVTGYAKGEQGQNMDFEPSEEALRAADTILSGQYEDQTGGATHYVNKNISQPSWANNGTFKRRGNHWFGDADGVGAVNGNTGPIAGSTPVTRTTSRQNPVDAYQDALIATGLFTPDEINQKMQFINQAGDEREQDFIDQKLLKDQQDAELVREQQAQAQIDAIISDKNLTNADLNRDLLEDDRFTATEKLENMRSATGIADSAEGLLAPSVASDPRLQTINDSINSTIATAIESTPQSQMIDSISDYKENPTESLIKELDLGNDGQNPIGIGGLTQRGETGFDSNNLKNLIGEYAEKFGVTEEVVAVAMRKAFERNPLGPNNLRNRFKESAVGEVIANTLDQKSIADHRDKRNRAEEVKVRVNRINNEINQLQQRAAKGGNRQAISQQIANLMVEMSSIQSENSEYFGTPN